MSEEERNKALRDTAMIMIGGLEWERIGEKERARCIEEARRIVSAFLRAASALPSRHKLLAREATEGMRDAMWQTSDSYLDIEIGLKDADWPEKVWTAAHDAAPDWSQP